MTKFHQLLTIARADNSTAAYIMVEGAANDVAVYHALFNTSMLNDMSYEGTKTAVMREGYKLTEAAATAVMALPAGKTYRR